MQASLLQLFIVIDVLLLKLLMLLVCLPASLQTEAILAWSSPFASDPQVAMLVVDVPAPLVQLSS